MDEMPTEVQNVHLDAGEPAPWTFCTDNTPPGPERWSRERQMIEAVISDFGGVLTVPLIDSFLAYQESSGISLEDARAGDGDGDRAIGANPLFELECGRITEAAFLQGVGARAHRAARTARDARGLRRGATSLTCTPTSG